MKLIQLPTGYGKTIIAIHTAIDNKVPIVVPTESDKNKLLSVYNELKCRNQSECKIVRNSKLVVITWEEYINNKKYRNIKNIVIDDLDKILQIYFDIDITQAVVTCN